MFSLVGKSEDSQNNDPDNSVNPVVDNNLEEGSQNSNIDEVPADNLNLISEAEISSHDSEQDCWVVYKSKVYDLTDYLPEHPGRANTITPYCGTSSGFENAFIRQHGTSKASLLVKVAVLIGDFEKVGSI